jgi:hypothetical protein
MNGKTVNENVICNGNYCLRYLRYPNGVAVSGWRDNGNPIYLPTYNEVWKDSRISALWSGNGITVAWTDPINNRVTLCNHSDCRSLQYSPTWLWRFNGDSIKPFPPGVTELNAAWTSPVTSVISQCVKNTCWKYDIPNAKYMTSQDTLISTATALANPTGLTTTCNSNGTVTLRWNSVSGAREYGARIDEQSTNANSPLYNWKTQPNDQSVTTSQTTANFTIISGRYYQPAVTAVATAGAAHPVPSWQSKFICNVSATATRAPVATTTRVPAATATRIPSATPTRVPTARPITCTDSDGGNVPTVGGTATLSTGTSRSDSCTNSVLTEAYCSGSTIATVIAPMAAQVLLIDVPAPTARPTTGNVGTVTLNAPINSVALKPGV